MVDSFPNLSLVDSTSRKDESQPMTETPPTPVAEPAEPAELVYTHSTSRGIRCACTFGASDATEGVGLNGHPDGLFPDLQEDGSAGAKQAARERRTATIEELRAQIASLEAEDSAVAPTVEPSETTPTSEDAGI